MRILIGATASVAVVKLPEIIQQLKQKGHEVRVVMTTDAAKLLPPLTVQAFTGSAVREALFDPEHEASMGHIELARWADKILIAPASADFLAKASVGIADNLLLTILLAARAPIYIAPAMNPAMWQHPLTTRNVERLKQIGYKFLEPESGMVLCGEEGEGRLMSVATLVEQFLGSQSVLQGKTILITAGPTREPIDPVRYVTNRSSGKMGYALAKSASALGAKVILISGPTALKRPSTLHFIEVGTAAEMLSATLAHLPGCDLLIASAAVADYSPIEVATQKIKKKADHFSIDLKRTEDILLKISTMPHRPLLVGFAAETSELETHALNKLKEKRLDAIIANDVSQNDIGFERDDNACTIYFKDGKPHIFSKTSKVQLAERILQTLGEKFYAKGST